MNPPEHLKNKINIEAFDYPLPEERIAKFPLPQRDASKLLLLKSGEISEDVFRNVFRHLPENIMLVFNQTKVVQARLVFKKETGAKIELFCLEPAADLDYQMAFQQSGSVVWKCLVGNSKRWKAGILRMKIPLVERVYEIFAERIRREAEYSVIRFSWKPAQISFAEILELSGQIPIPPYLNREAVEQDAERYQTIYARNRGSVAAPTAGLHFTNEVMKQIRNKGIKTANLTLHVGAGTFKPVVAKDVSSHVMHYEQISVDKKTIKDLLDYVPGKVIAVGTTSVRTLESLYWHGIKLMRFADADNGIDINQWEPYQLDRDELPDAKEVLSFLLKFMEQKNLQSLNGSTQIMILPGYDYKIVNGIITNFHQPKSTLLLLVSALIGDCWREVYDYALKNDFRFLSYGDSCLFLPDAEVIDDHL